MPVLERLIDADAFMQMQHLPEYRGNEYELIDGEMVEMVAPGGIQGVLAGRLFGFIDRFAWEGELGITTVESGYRTPQDRQQVLRPDVAYTSYDRAPSPIPRGLMPVMPDLAVEIASPSDSLPSLRAKAQLYLRNGTRLVWLVFPDDQGIEVHSISGERQSLGVEDTLTGGDVLPGFQLELKRLFSL